MFTLIEIQLEKKGKKTNIVYLKTIFNDNNDQNYGTYLSLIILFFGYNCKNYFFFQILEQSELVQKIFVNITVPTWMKEALSVPVGQGTRPVKLTETPVMVFAMF